MPNNIGAFGENFPYSNQHDMNQDWVIKVVKDFLDQYTQIQETITDGLTELNETAERLNTLLQEWYDTHSEDIANQLASALAELNEWYDEHQAFLDSYVTSQIALFNTRAEEKAQETLASIPADYTDLSDNVLVLNDSFTKGLNLYSKVGTQINKALTNGDGTERDLTGAYLSDYIAVEPETEYYINHSIGSSSNHPTIAYYTLNKTYISQGFQASAGAYTITTPANTKFIRVVWLTASGSSMLVEKTPTYDNAIMNSETLSPFASDKCRLFSDGQIIYNPETGYITSTTNIVINFGTNVHNFGTSVNVGIGDLLYFNSKTKTLHAEPDFIINKDEYIISILTANELTPVVTPNNCALFAFKIFNYDEINNVFTINVPAQPAFLVFNNYVFRIEANTNISFNITEDIAFIYYNTQTKTFVKSTDYGDLVRYRGFVIFSKFFWNHWCIADPITKISNTSYKRAVCFGDSLTWYDGHEYDWGSEQGNICKGFESYILKYFNLREVSNQGISGATTPQVCSALKSYARLADFDYLFIMSGDNDDRLGISLGSPAVIGSTFDTTTVYGALQSAIEYALTAKPTIKIILMTEPKGWTYRNGAYYLVDSDIPEAIRNVAKIYSLPVIDLWNESGVNELTRNTYYNDPPTNNLYMYHPNNMGWEKISKLIVRNFELNQ